MSRSPLREYTICREASLSPVASASACILSSFSTNAFHEFNLSPLTATRLSPFCIPALSKPPPGITESTTLGTNAVTNIGSSFAISNKLISGIYTSASFPSRNTVTVRASAISRSISTPKRSNGFSSARRRISPSRKPISRARSLNFIP